MPLRPGTSLGVHQVWQDTGTQLNRSVALKILRSIEEADG
jgi:hypothetical protein